MPIPKWSNTGLHLGSGSFGSVFEAKDRDGRVTGAVKILRNNQVKRRPHLVDDFKFEAKIGKWAYKVGHPNLCHGYDYGTTAGGDWFYFMEKLGGQDLGRVIKDKRKLATRTVIAIGRQAAAGLAKLHGRGIIHCDVKPPNIICQFRRTGTGTEVGSVKVIDYGLAIHIRDAPGASAGGTAAYAAPEELTSEGPHPRSDVYSLGLTLFECALGYLPPVHDVHFRKTGIPESPQALGFKTLLENMLRSDYRSRPQMADVERELVQLERGTTLLPTSRPVVPPSVQPVVGRGYGGYGGHGGYGGQPPPAPRFGYPESSAQTPLPVRVGPPRTRIRCRQTDPSAYGYNGFGMAPLGMNIEFGASVLDLEDLF